MLICVSGSHGEGKTTLLQKYTTLHSNVKWIENTASRDTLREMGTTLEQVYTSKKQIMAFQEAVLLKQNHIVEQANSFDELCVTERSYLDLIAYTALGIGGEVEYQEWLDDYTQRCMDGHDLTTALFHLEGRISPLGGTNPDDDGTRPVGKMFTTATTAIISHLAHNSRNIPANIMYNPELDVRVDSLHTFIKVIRGDV